MRKRTSKRASGKSSKKGAPTKKASKTITKRRPVGLGTITPRKEKVTCESCKLQKNVFSIVKYSDSLLFYWCHCSLTSHVLRKTDGLL